MAIEFESNPAGKVVGNKLNGPGEMPFEQTDVTAQHIPHCGYDETMLNWAENKK